MTGVLLAFVALAMFSTNIMLTRLAATRLGTDVGFPITVLVNIAFAGLLFGGELLLRREPLAWDGQGALLFALAGLFTTYLGRFFVLEVIARLGPAKASAFQVSSPLFTFVIALIFLGERLTPLALVGMVLTVLGLLLVSLSGARTTGTPAPKESRGRLKRWMQSGIAIGLMSSAAYGVGNVMRGAAVREWDEPILGALLGALLGIVLHFLIGSGHAAMLRGLRTAHRGGVLLFALSGVLTISAQMVVISAMKYAPVSVVALITLCTPILVFPMSYFLLKNDEGINPRTLVGAVLTLSGIGMIIVH
jgi:drug/metabolite transporter (DMT)-like permease